MKPILFILAAVLLGGCANALTDLRDATNDIPGLEWVIPDNLTERYLGAVESAFERAAGAIEEHADLFTAGERADYQALRGDIAGALAAYRLAMRAHEPEAMAAPEQVLRDRFPALLDVWREGARRYAKQRLAERLGGSG